MLRKCEILVATVISVHVHLQKCNKRIHHYNKTLNSNGNMIHLWCGNSKTRIAQFESRESNSMD